MYICYPYIHYCLSGSNIQKSMSACLKENTDLLKNKSIVIPQTDMLASLVIHNIFSVRHEISASPYTSGAIFYSTKT